MGTTTTDFTVSPFVPSANNYSTNLSSFWRIKLVSSKDVCEIVDGGRCVTDGPGNYGNREYCEVEALRSLIVTAKQYSVEAKYDSITINGIPYMNSIPNEGVSMNKGARWFWNSDSSVTRPGYKLCAEEANTDVSGYQLLSNGRCPPGREVKSLSECSTAAKYLNLYDQSASSDNQPHGVSYDPPFCYYEGNQLKFNGGRNTGSCDSYDRCLCKASATTTTTPGCGDPYYKGDGFCDDFNNNPGCDYDGGDCCAATSRAGHVKTKYCKKCACIDRDNLGSVANATGANATKEYNSTAATQGHTLPRTYHGTGSGR